MEGHVAHIRGKQNYVGLEYVRNEKKKLVEKNLSSDSVKFLGNV